MVRKLAGRILCLFVGHRRSKGRARERGKTYVSVCKRCGVPMRQLPNRKWVADRLAREMHAS